MVSPGDSVVLLTERLGIGEESVAVGGDAVVYDPTLGRGESSSVAVGDDVVVVTPTIAQASTEGVWKYEINGGPTQNYIPHTVDVSGSEHYDYDSGAYTANWPHATGNLLLEIMEDSSTDIYYFIYAAEVSNADWDINFSTSLDMSTNIDVEDDPGSSSGDEYRSDLHHHQGGGRVKTDGAVMDLSGFSKPIDITISLSDLNGNLDGFGVVTENGSATEFAGKDGSIRLFN